MMTLLAILLLAVPAVAGDRIVGEVHPNLAGGHTVYDLDGDVILEGFPSLGGGELFRDPSSGRFEFETREGLDGDTIFDLGTGSD